MELGLPPATLVSLLALGLCAGVLGGMLGVGGSVIMIPGLTMLLGYNQHVYQATAMIANVAVSFPAAMRHYRSAALDVRAIRWIMPFAMVFVLIGVWLSNLSVFRGVEGGQWLGRVLAAYLLYLIAANIRLMIVGRARKGPSDRRVTGPRSAAVGSVMGTTAGLLGIGGGVLAVPLQQSLLRLPIKSSIANSSVVVCLTAGVGAVVKNTSLGLHGAHWHDSVTLALFLIPSCWVGGHVGAILTHRLSVRQVRSMFILIMIVAAYKMAALPWPTS